MIALYAPLIIILQKDAEDALAEALPALEAARLALDDLEKNDVTEIRSFAKPPKPVQTVCECIVVMRGIKEVSWKSAKGMMAEAGFLRSLTEMDVDGITQKQVTTVKGMQRITVYWFSMSILLKQCGRGLRNVISIHIVFGVFI